MDGLAVFFGLIALLLVGCAVILPVVAFVRTLRIGEIEHRLARRSRGNTPLTIRAARFEVVRREVLFHLPAEMKTPLYLYAGNPQAQPPGYDFATQLLPEAKAEATASVTRARRTRLTSRRRCRGRRSTRD